MNDLNFTETYESKDEQAMIVTDPVCGMQIEIDEAAAQADHAGWAYFFCSTRCHQLFSQSPTTYAKSGNRHHYPPTAESNRSNHGER